MNRKNRYQSFGIFKPGSISLLIEFYYFISPRAISLQYLQDW